MNSTSNASGETTQKPDPERVPVQLLIACVSGFDTLEERNAANTLLHSCGLTSPDELTTSTFRRTLEGVKYINRLLVPFSPAHRQHLGECLTSPQFTDIAQVKHAETVQAQQALEPLVAAIKPLSVSPQIDSLSYGNTQDDCLAYMSGDDSRELLDGLHDILANLRRRAEEERNTSYISAGLFLIQMLYPRLFEPFPEVRYRYRLSGRKFLAFRFSEFCIVRGFLSVSDHTLAMKSLTQAVMQGFLNAFLSVALFASRPYQQNLRSMLRHEKTTLA